MPQPVVYIAVTSHGFGHAVRSATIAAKIKQICPDIQLILATVAPEWLLKSYIHEDFIYHPCVFDVGVIQSDSLTMDKATTIAKMRHIIARKDEIIAEEVKFIRENRVSLVIADVPALAIAIAHEANVPCWTVSNFAWNFIYRHWGEEFNEIAAWMEDYYRQCDRLFRLPLAESMAVFPNITDVGLTGTNPRYSEAEIRDKFQLGASKEKTVLLTFGGLGLEAIPYDNLKRFDNWQFITFDRNAPDLPNLFKVNDRSYRPVDFMHICDLIVSKPGYSTFAEALYLDLPIISLTREDFPESTVLLEGVRDYTSHRILDPQEFFTGNWDFLDRDLIPPRQSTKLAKNGTETIVEAVMQELFVPI
jgi:hypothetical protein